MLLSEGRSFTTSFLTKYNNSAISQFQKQLKELKNDMADNKREQKELSREIRDAEKEYNLINKKVKEAGKATKEQQERLDELTNSIKTDKEALEKLKLQQAQIQKNIDSTNKSVENQKKAFNELITSMDGAKAAGADLAKQIATVSAALVAAVAGLFASTKSAAEWADNVNTLAKTTGIGTAEIQKFMYASDIVDVSIETLSGSLAKLTGAMTNARNNAKSAAAEGFSKLGVSVTDVTGALRDREQVFYETIDALGRIANETERDALALSVFGRSAQELNPLIQGGVHTLKELGDEAERAGLILDQKTLDNLNGFNDKLDLLKSKGTAIKNLAASEMTPALDGLLEVADELLDDISEMAQSGELKKFAKDLGEGIKNAANALKNVIEFVWKYKEAIGAAVAAMVTFKAAMSITSLITSLVTGFKALSVATKAETADMAALNAVMNANPIGLVISLVASFAVGLGTLAIATSNAAGKTNEYVQELRELQQAELKTISSAAGEAALLREQYTELQNLAAQTELTTTQKERLADLEKSIADKIGVTTSELKTQTGVYRDLTAEIDEYIRRLIEKTRYEYYENIIKTASTALEELNSEVDKFRAKYRDTWKEDILDPNADIWSNMPVLQFPDDHEFLPVIMQYREAKKAIDEAAAAIQNLGTASSGTTSIMSAFPEMGQTVAASVEAVAESAKDLAKEQKDLQNQSSSLRSEMASLAGTMQQLEDGQALTLDTVLQLIDKYPELAAELLAAGNNADLQRIAIEHLFDAKKADYLITQQKAIDNIEASNRETETAIKNIEQQIKAYQMLGTVAIAVNSALHPEISVAKGLTSALYPVGLTAQMMALQLQLDTGRSVKAGLEAKLAAVRNISYSSFYKSNNGRSGTSETPEERRIRELTDAQSLALAAYSRLVENKITMINKETQAAEDAANKQIAAIDKVMQKRRQENEDQKRQNELNAIDAKLRLQSQQLTEFEIHELEQRRQEILNEQTEVNYERAMASQKESLKAGAAAVRSRNEAAISGLNASKTQLSDHVAYIQGTQTYDQRVKNNSNTVNVQIVQNGLNVQQLANRVVSQVLKELGGG